jgi:hypothetical protein
VSVFIATNLKLIAVTAGLAMPTKPKLALPNAQTSRATVFSLEQQRGSVKS